MIFLVLFSWGIILITIIQSLFSDYKKRKKVQKKLSLELSKIGREVKILYQLNRNNPLNTIPVSSTVIPLLENVTVNDLVYLTDELAKKTYQLNDELKKAETFRRLALAEVDSTKKQIYTNGYAEELASIVKLIEEIQKL